jgi:thiamine-phosphate pyrophosphorylase
MGFVFPSCLYVIVDPAGVAGRNHLELARAALAAGVPLLQLRMKHADTREFIDCARAMRALCTQQGAKFLVNDRVDIAVLVDADGVHLGQDDLSPSLARHWLGKEKIIGWSTHNLAQAKAAQVAGLVDYIGVGPIFPTSTKERPDPVLGLDGLREIRAAVDLPIAAIGGITPETAREVLAAGADAVAMIGAIAHAPDPAALLKELRVLLDGPTVTKSKPL